jgi:hypothetical protein
MEAHMATHTIDHDRTTQWKINQDNDTWTLDANAQLHVTGAPAVFIDSGFDNNTVNVKATSWVGKQSEFIRMRTTR